MPVVQRPLEIKPGSEVVESTLTNKRGTRLVLLDLGAILKALHVADRDGQRANVVLGFDSPQDYVVNGPYFGAICGRFANRIARGRFSLEGETFQLATNNPPNHLHGGERGLNQFRWNSQVLQDGDEPSVEFYVTSPDGNEGFPGTLQVRVRYSLSADDTLRLDYWATTDRATPLNLTNHAYWNLSGAKPGQSILPHQLQLNCSRFLPVDSTQIPTGELRAVAGTAMDFTTSRVIGERIAEVPGGYDHCYVIDGDSAIAADQPVLAARVEDPDSGRAMEVWTTEPGIQLYTGNFLDGTASCGGFGPQQGLCLECQHFPDSPNRPEFPETILQPGQTYRQTTLHRFFVTD